VQGPVTETVLLVDDEPQVVGIVRAMLQRAGYKVLEATEGEEALAMAQLYPGPIHLLLTDIVMPAMDGRELARRLKASRPSICVLYMSGFLRETITRLYGIAMGRIAFVQKPFTADVLISRVREALDAADRAANRTTAAPPR
jgi:DNA-binding response OmpR family regulator